MSQPSIGGAITRQPLTFVGLPITAPAAKFTDTLDIDQGAHLLYAGDNYTGGLDLYDIATPEARFLQSIRVRGNLYGVCFAKNVNKVFVGVGGSIVSVIDIDPASPTVNTEVARIDTDGRGAVDLVGYVPSLRKLYAGNRHLVNGVDDGFLTAIDAASNTIVGRINGLGRTLEQPQFNPADGMLYVTGAGSNALYQVDPKTDTLMKTFHIEDDCHPNGLAINPKTGMALLACNREHPHVVIWDLKRQQIAAVVAETGGSDGAIYDPVADRFFTAAFGFTGGPVMGIFDGSGRFLTNVPTEAASSWVAYDQTNRLVYAPATRDGRPGLLSFPLPE